MAAPLWDHYRLSLVLEASIDDGLESLAQRTNRVLKQRVLILVVIFGIEIFDLRLRQIQLRLGELDDRGQAQVKAALGEIQTQSGLTQKLRGNIDALESSNGTCPGRAHIARDALLLIAQALFGFQCTLPSCLAAGGKQVSVENRNTDVRPDGFVSLRDIGRVDIRQRAADSDRGQGGA